MVSRSMKRRYTKRRNTKRRYTKRRTKRRIKNMKNYRKNTKKKSKLRGGAGGTASGIVNLASASQAASQPAMEWFKKMLPPDGHNLLSRRLTLKGIHAELTDLATRAGKKSLSDLNVIDLLSFTPEDLEPLSSSLEIHLLPAWRPAARQWLKKSLEALRAEESAVAASPMPNSAATGSQPAATPSPNTFNKSPIVRDNGSKLILSTNEYGFIEDIKYDAKRDNIVFPRIESCNGIIVVLIDQTLKKETKIFGYHRPPHVGDMKHPNNDNKFLNLIKDNIENPKNLAFFVVSLGFNSIDEVISEISRNLDLSILNLGCNKSYKINENLKGVIFEQRLVETTTLTADWKTIRKDTNCLVMFSPIRFFDYGWIIKQGEKTAKIRLD